MVVIAIMKILTDTRMLIVSIPTREIVTEEADLDLDQDHVDVSHLLIQ